VEYALGDPEAEAHIAAIRERIGLRLGPAHPIFVGLSKQHYLYRIIDPHPF
jgi:hypothetical protein